MGGSRLDGKRGKRSGPFEGPVHSRPAHAERGGDLGNVVVAAVVHAADLAVLGGLEPGLLAPELAVLPGDGQALAGALVPRLAGGEARPAGDRASPGFGSGQRADARQPGSGYSWRDDPGRRDSGDLGSFPAGLGAPRVLRRPRGGHGPGRLRPSRRRFPAHLPCRGIRWPLLRVARPRRNVPVPSWRLHVSRSPGTGPLPRGQVGMPKSGRRMTGFAPS